MFILLLIGLALVVVSVALALRAVNMSRARSAEMVETIDAYGFSGRTESVLVRSGDSTRRTVDDLVSRIGGFFTARMTTLDSERMRKQLIAAGHVHDDTAQVCGLPGYLGDRSAGARYLGPCRYPGYPAFSSCWGVCSRSSWV